MQIVDACCIEQCHGSCEHLSFEVIPNVLHAPARQYGRISKPKYTSKHISRDTLPPLVSGRGAEHGADAMHVADLPEFEYDAHREYIAIVHDKVFPFFGMVEFLPYGTHPFSGSCPPTKAVGMLVSAISCCIIFSL